METDTFDLTKWDFEEVEYILRDHAEDNGEEYDEKKPLDFIGEHAGRRALDGLGLTARQIQPYSGYEYATVSGWFRAGRDPSGTTFRDGIFPTLCEAYVRLHEQDPQYQEARDAYLAGGDIDEEYRLAVERKIATLFCTGLLETKEEREREHELDREAYHRAVLRFASVYLEGHELHALADVALATLNAHAVRPALAEDLGDDRLSEIMGRTRWYWHAEHRDDLERLFDGVDGDEASLITEAGMHICSPLIEEHALDGYLEMASDDDLESMRDAVREAMEARGLA